MPKIIAWDFNYASSKIINHATYALMKRFDEWHWIEKNNKLFLRKNYFSFTGRTSMIEHRRSKNWHSCWWKDTDERRQVTIAGSHTYVMSTILPSLLTKQIMLIKLTSHACSEHMNACILHYQDDPILLLYTWWIAEDCDPPKAPPILLIPYAGSGSNAPPEEY